MIDFSHDQAILFRVLTSFFGKDRVLPNISVMTVCGGTLPLQVVQAPKNFDLEKWARSNKCLFTIVDASDAPRMVIEFFSGFSSAVDVVEEQHQRYLPPIFKALGITYIAMTNQEFAEIVDPSSSFDIFAFLKDKVESTDFAE